MKRMKYFLILLVVLSLAMVTIPLSPVSAAGPTISIGSPIIVLEGGTFAVNVNVDAITDLDSWQFAIAYNPAVIRVIGPEGGADGVTAGLMNGTRVIPVSIWGFSPIGTQGAVMDLNAVPILQPISGTGYLAQVHFQVLPGTATQSSFLNFVDLPADRPPFTRGLWNNTGSNITGVTWTNGSVSVVASFPQITTSSPLASGEVGIAYSQTLAASDGTPPYVWSIQSGTLPPGLSLDSTSGAITGKPTTVGAFSVIVAVTDSFIPAVSVSKLMALNIFLRGDANGDGVVNMGDATKVMRIILGLDPTTPGADANGDGVVNMGDVTKIELIILGLN